MSDTYSPISDHIMSFIVTIKAKTLSNILSILNRMTYIIHVIKFMKNQRNRMETL